MSLVPFLMQKRSMPKLTVRPWPLSLASRGFTSTYKDTDSSSVQTTNRFYTSSTKTKEFPPSHQPVFNVGQSPYRPTITRWNTLVLPNADALSRLPLPTSRDEVPVPAEIINVIQVMDDGPLTFKEIQVLTAKDKVMSQVLSWVLSGWPEQPTEEPEFRPYVLRRNELLTQCGCLMWGSRVIIPPPARKMLLEELHDTHCGLIA
jgi:hypothetical protein